jgi:DNA-binding PadR family transcriptional regulator
VLKLLKSKKAITQGEHITEALCNSALHKLEAEGILDVRLKGNRMRKYYKLTEAGTYVKP